MKSHILARYSIAFTLALATSRLFAQTQGSASPGDLDELADLKASFAGKYAHFDVVAYTDKVVLTEMRTLVITYGITEFFVDAKGSLMARDRFCHAAHKSNFPFQSTVPDSFTRAIVPRLAEVQLKQENGTVSLLRPETPTAIGIKLDDPVHDKLPGNPKDPRISDDDHDGKPGVTVKLRLHNLFDTELYIARREIFAYELQPMEAGILSGFVSDRSEQLIVGSPLPLLRGQRSPKQASDKQLSPITLVPVDDDYDCDRLMADRDWLLPPEPEVWR